MGQARIRKEEINKLKSQPPEKITLQLIAVRHMKNGHQEMLAFGNELVDMKLNKNDLLNAICSTGWGRDRKMAAAGISQYFIQTKTYQLTKAFTPYGFEVHFWEEGSQSDHPGCGCREIITIGNKAAFDKRYKQLESTS